MMKFFEKSYVKYGLIQCLITVLCLLTMELTGQNESFDQKSPLFMLGTMIAPAVVWFFGIKARRHALKGKLTWKEGLKEGFRISLVYAIISPFIFMAYYLVINPSIIDYVRETYQLNSASNTVVILADMVAQFVSAIIFGTIYAAVISYFLKTKSK